MAAGDRLLFAITTACGMTAGVVDCGAHGLRIRIKGAGWAPEKFKTQAEALAKLLDMKTYTPAEADMARRACKDDRP